MTRPGHVACFPDRPFKAREKTPVWWHDGRFENADGVTWGADNPTDFIELARDGGWDVHMSSVRSLPWIEEWLADPKIDKYGKPPSVQGLSIHVGHGRIRVIESRTWNVKEPSQEYLQSQMAVSRVSGTTEASPVSLGLANMRRLWQGKVDSRPNVWARDDLWRHAIGARSDGECSEHVYRNVHQVDMTDAYATMAAEPLPSGSATYISWNVAREPMGIKWWFCECEVSIPNGLASRHSPILVKSDDGLLRELSEPGVHRAWITSDEADAAVSCGMGVVAVRGWGWWHLESHLSRWSAFQRNARKQLGKVAAGMLKLSTVAAIGAMFVKDKSWKFQTPSEDPTGSDCSSPSRPVLINGHFTKYSWVEEIDRDKPALTHVWVAILAKCRLAQWRKMVAEEQAGNEVISTDTDEIILAHAPRTPLGTYRYKGMIREYVIPARRWGWKDGEIKAPGLPEEERGALDELTAEEYGLLISLRGRKKNKYYDYALSVGFKEGWNGNHLDSESASGTDEPDSGPDRGSAPGEDQAAAGRGLGKAGG